MKTLAKSIWTTYKQSWGKLWSLRALWIVLADSAFYVLLLLIAGVATDIAARLALRVAPGISPDIAETFLAKLVVILAIAAVVVWVIWTVTRAIIWQLLGRTRFKPVVWARFFGLNVIWTIIMALPVWLLARRVIAATIPGTMVSSTFVYLHYALIFVLAYFGYNVFYAFIREQKVFDAYRKGLLRAFSDASYLVPAFLALVATMIILGLLNPLITRLPDAAGVVVSYAVLFGSLTWAKIYFYDVLEGGVHRPEKRPAAEGPAKAKMAKKKS